VTDPTEQDLAALVEEATKRSGLVWLDYPGAGRSRPAWHVWHEGAAYVVSDGPEQPLPGIERADRVRVTVRAKDTRARLVTWVADAATVAHGTPEWASAAEALRGQRLNASHAESLVLVWGADSTITRLRPTGEVLEHPGARPTGSLAAPPVDTAATTRGRLPWVAHRRQSRAPDL
jgi:hypothetical protein